MRERRIWPFVWIGLAVFLVVRTGIRDRGVITDHIEFGRRVLAGLDLYAPFDGKPLHPPYPPGFGILAAPFSLVPERVARFLWGILQVGALFAIGAWLRAALARVAPTLVPRLHFILFLTALLASRYALRDTHGGGGNLINLALALGALAMAGRGRGRGRAVAAALLLGLSLATKPTHLLIVPLLWLFGHRNAALGSVAAAAGFTGLSLVLLGQGLAPLETWIEGSWAYARMHPFDEPEMGFPPFTWMNQCLRCAVARYLGDVPPQYAAEISGFFPGLGLSRATTSVISGLSGLALLGATGLRVLRDRGCAASQPWLVASVLCTSLLLSPISWKAHHTALVPAFFLLLARGLEGRRALLVFLGAYAALLIAGGDVIGKAFKELQSSLYIVTAGTVTIWALCLGAARTVNTERALSPGTGSTLCGSRRLLPLLHRGFPTRPAGLADYGHLS